VSRPLRIEIENGWYHVISRGIDGRQLFPDDRSKEHFLELLQVMPSRFSLRIHAYVLMGNHYHLQIETLKPNLSRAIQWLNLSFSAWYNRLQRRRGPLLQGRFKAILHDPQHSALLINRYIHLNPVRIQRLGGHEARAGAEERLGSENEKNSSEVARARVEALNSYGWSSYPAYIGKVKKPDWLTIESIHGLFGRSSVQSFRSAYRHQLEELAALGKGEDSWKESVKASVLHGAEEFVADMLEELKGDRREQRAMREKERLRLEWPRIIAAISEVWKAPWEEVSRKRGNGAVGLAFFLGQRHAGITLRDLGEHMGDVEYPAVSAAIARFQNRLRTDRSLQRRVKQVEKLLKVEI
jgi:putative transposase